MPRAQRPVEERFWEKVDRSGGGEACWPWTASRDEYGYGFFRISHEMNMRKSNRVAWYLTHGEWPELQVLHRCDNPPCCNPAHLFLGTNADNVADRQAKGRSARGVTHYGETSPKSKLTADEVREIRRLYAAGGATQVALGAMYGVGQTQIGRIVRLKRWKQDGL